MELPTINTSEIIELVEGGSIDPLLIKIWMKEITEALETIKPIADSAALSEAEKYGQKSFEKNGYRFELSEFGTKYDYSGTGHPKWNQLSFKAKEINNELKGVEETLKSLKSSITLVDDDSGEIVTVYPPAKKSTSGIKLSRIR